MPMSFTMSSGGRRLMSSGYRVLREDSFSSTLDGRVSDKRRTVLQGMLS